MPMTRGGGRSIQRAVTVPRNLTRQSGGSSMGSKSKARQAALKYGYRSGLEEKISKEIKEAGHTLRYENMKVSYQKPASTYTPDFLLDNGIVIETKGRFVGADRTKHLLIKKQRPELDIRFVFNNPNAKLSKTSKTTYGQWCDRHGFEYSKGSIPAEWFEEKINEQE